MKIDWNWGNPPKRVPKDGWIKRVFGSKPTPLHMSNHYNRSHFHHDGQPRLF